MVCRLGGSCEAHRVNRCKRDKGNGMNKTRGQLVPARIVKVTEDLQPINDSAVKCMFNPHEYTLSKSNSFKEQKAANGKNSPPAELSQAGAQTLKLELWFDTYTPDKEAVYGTEKDVSQITDKLWEFMKVSTETMPDKDDKKHVPLVAFHWGVFFFVSYITNMTQRFTLFTREGIPVRAKVDVTFTQYRDIDDRRKDLFQNPTSGGGPVNRIHRVVAGDRLDLIANQVYRDAAKWRYIADYNGLKHPADIYPGQTLIIPFEQEAA